MPDQPGEQYFMWVIGGLAALGAAGFGVTRKAILDLWSKVNNNDHLLWTHNDKHAEDHVRPADVGDLRNVIQGTELRTYMALEKMEERLMAELRPMRLRVDTLAEDLAELQGKMNARPNGRGQQG